MKKTGFGSALALPIYNITQEKLILFEQLKNITFAVWNKHTATVYAQIDSKEILTDT
jgi:hypothetical protein